MHQIVVVETLSSKMCKFQSGINFSEEEGLRAYMRFSLGITFLGDRKKSEQHSKNSDPVKKAGKRTKSDFSKNLKEKTEGKLRAYMTFSLRTTFLGNRKKSEQQEKIATQ